MITYEPFQLSRGRSPCDDLIRPTLYLAIGTLKCGIAAPSNGRGTYCNCRKGMLPRASDCSITYDINPDSARRRGILGSLYMLFIAVRSCAVKTLTRRAGAAILLKHFAIATVTGCRLRQLTGDFKSTARRGLSKFLANPQQCDGPG